MAKEYENKIFSLFEDTFKIFEKHNVQVFSKGNGLTLFEKMSDDDVKILEDSYGYQLFDVEDEIVSSPHFYGGLIFIALALESGSELSRKMFYSKKPARRYIRIEFKNSGICWLDK